MPEITSAETHPIITSAAETEIKVAGMTRKITPCAMLTTGFGTVSALRVTENGVVSYQIAATCRFDTAKKASGACEDENPHTFFGRMNVRGGVLVMDVVSGEDPDAVCLLNDNYTSFEAMWANYEMMVASYMDINEVWVKERAKEKVKEKGA